MYVLHILLHGALMLEGPPTLMLTGQKDVLVEWPSMLSCHGGRALLLTWCPDAHPSHVAAWCSDAWRLAPTDVDRAEECPGGGTFCAQLPWGGPYYSPDAQMYRTSFPCPCMELWCLMARWPHWCGQGRRMSWWRALLLVLTWCPDEHPSRVAAWCSDAWRLARTDVDRAEECPDGGPVCACKARLGLETDRNTCQSGLQIRTHGWKFWLNSSNVINH